MSMMQMVKTGEADSRSKKDLSSCSVLKHSATIHDSMCSTTNRAQVTISVLRSGKITCINSGQRTEANSHQNYK